MITIKINYSDSDYTITRINATIEEAKQYYIGKTFNTGSISDHMVKCVSIELLDE